MRLTRSRGYLLAKNAAKRLLPGRFAWRPAPDDRDVVEAVEPVRMAWPAGVRKPLVGLVPDRDHPPYWTKYRHFLEANGIPWELYDVHRSDWRQRAARLDAVVWRPLSFPSELEECRRKVAFLEGTLGLFCYPGLREALLYEDKLLQTELLQHHGFPVPETFITHDEDEALAYVERCQYPLVWKVGCGSGSLGVELIGDVREARRAVRKVFGHDGRATYWPYLRQKDYVYLQRLEPNQGYDLRVIVIGDLALGYYRDVPAGEFRASGMDTVRREDIPDDALNLAHAVAQAVAVPQLAVDMLRAPDGSLLIIELSSFPQVKTPFQCQRDGLPGVYRRDAAGRRWTFVPMLVWSQQLALRQALRDGWLAAGRGR